MELLWRVMLNKKTPPELKLNRLAYGHFYVLKSLRIIIVVALTLLVMEPSQGQDHNWQLVVIPGVCSFKIPATFELQNGGYREETDDLLKKIFKIEDPDRIIIQPKGINDFDPDTLKKYCRIIIKTETKTQGTFPKLGDKLNFSNNELNQMYSEIKGQLSKDISNFKSKGYLMEIISLEMPQIIQINRYQAIKYEYVRSINQNPPVRVIEYLIFNNDSLHKISLSYRISEKAIWEDDLFKVIKTFDFIKR